MSDLKQALLEVIAAKVLSFTPDQPRILLPGAFGSIKWTGWKSHYCEINPHAQIVWVVELPDRPGRRTFYVDLPSMSHGEATEGGTIDISFHNDRAYYITKHTTEAEVRAWFIEGFGLLMNDVLDANPWLCEVPKVNG